MRANLLSVEFLRLAREHLKSGGILYYNTTWSPEALLTAAATFPHMLRIGNFAAVSDSPIKFDKQLWDRSLRAYRIDGVPVFDLDQPDHRVRLDQVLLLADTLHRTGKDPMHELEEGSEILKRLHGGRIITDDNMGTEWK